MRHVWDGQWRRGQRAVHCGTGSLSRQHARGTGAAMRGGAPWPHQGVMHGALADGYGGGRMAVRGAVASDIERAASAAASGFSPHLSIRLAAWRWCYGLEAAGLLLVGLAGFWAAGTAAGTASIAVLAMLAGAVALASALGCNRAPAFVLSAALALVSLAAGLALLDGPLGAAANPAPVFAAYFAGRGVLMVLVSVAHRRRHFAEWEWLTVSGVTSLMLALTVLSGLPGPYLWMFGVLFGVGMLFEASARAAIALAGGDVHLLADKPLD